MSATPILQFAPAALERDQAAAYVSLGISTFERLVQAKQAPLPRMFPETRRVAWLRSELDAWLLGLPPSNLLPPENTGAPKRGRKTKAQIIAQQVAPNAPTV
ncbi:helix-turn-helix transcriptional regulator [Delftia tsuruhatensis]|uniref:helix-turn-helix transcriptional regulator n=1 Tax=Delftia tsuruhatensis TaxID=180282 RepID=UPI000773D253|nr:hypothetical protein [Delftia tsuruhatensis]SFB50764.1 hypothetical protein SAMN05444579_107248 [Delftia tsuruhatensis]